MTKKELDIETIKRLYEHGGLTAYHVEYFSPAAFAVIRPVSTFSETVAKHELDRLRASGFVAEIKKELINFDGAFSK